VGILSWSERGTVKHLVVGSILAKPQKPENSNLDLTRSYIDLQPRVLNYCFKLLKQSSINKRAFQKCQRRWDWLYYPEVANEQSEFGILHTDDNEEEEEQENEVGENNPQCLWAGMHSRVCSTEFYSMGSFLIVRGLCMFQEMMS